MAVKIIFCSDPLNNKAPDMDYEAEWNAARKAGFGVSLIHFEDLLEGDANKAVRGVARGESDENAVYRGWMLKAELYETLYEALKEKKVTLLTDPEAYRRCHHFPESYGAMEKQTPRTVCLGAGDLSEQAIRQALDSFGANALIVKDYVKSRKHQWEEACFIPNASDADRALKVVRRFLELQGAELVGGLVLRQFEELEFLGEHPKSGMPLANERRLFFFNGEMIANFAYWDEVDYQSEEADTAPFPTIAKNVKSPFFTMDIAKKKNGEWIIIELGDGQVSGLPDNADLNQFYKAMRENIES